MVAKTEEAGLRGSHDFAPGIGSFGWKLGVFRTDSSDDILAIPVPNLQGFGYYQNIGSTRRQGIEAEANLKSRSFEIYANYALVDARFRDALSLGSNSPSADPATGTIQVEPGDQIPAIPRHRLKAGIDYLVTDKLKLGGDMLLVSSQYFVGDASNQQPKLPGYAVFNLHGSYDISKTIQLYARVDNVFDNHYSTYGTFFDTQALPNFTNAGAAFADARSVSPARPRAFYAGMKVTF